jgi:hypothetical protein
MRSSGLRPLSGRQAAEEGEKGVSKAPPPPPSNLYLRLTSAPPVQPPAFSSASSSYLAGALIASPD